MEARREDAIQRVPTFAELAAQEKGYRFPAGVPTKVEYAPGAQIGVGAVVLSIEEREVDKGPANLILVGPDGQETPIRDIQEGTALTRLNGTVVGREPQGKTTLSLDDRTVSRGVHCVLARVQGTKQLVFLDPGSENGVRPKFEAPPQPAQAAGPAQQSAEIFINQRPAAAGSDVARAAEQQGGLKTYGEIIAAMAAFRRGLREGTITTQAAQQELARLQQAAGAYKGSDVEMVQAALANAELTYQEVTGAQPARSDVRPQQAARQPAQAAQPGLSTGGEMVVKRPDQAPAQFRQTAQEAQRRAAAAEQQAGLPRNPTIQDVERMFHPGAVFTQAQIEALRASSDVITFDNPNGLTLTILEADHEDAHANIVELQRQKGRYVVIGRHSSARR